MQVPHMGWNELRPVGNASVLLDGAAGNRLYFVHSYCVRPTVNSRHPHRLVDTGA